MLVERMQHFVINVSAADVQPILGLSLQVDLDASFRLYGVCVWNLGVPEFDGVDGQVAIRIYRPNSQQIQRQLTSSNLLFPGNQYNLTGVSPTKALAAPIRPGVLFPAGSVINFDILGLGTGIAVPTGVMVVFIGTNIYQQGAVWNPQYPAKWKARPYLDNLTVPAIALTGLPALNQPFTAQADSDFVWQGGMYTDWAAGPVTDQLVDLGVIIRDPGYKAYSNTYVPVALLFPFLSGQAPGWLYPEIYIPRLGQIYFDFNYLYAGFTTKATPFTITLALKGMKVYAQ
jgi:hypothetical protein